MARRSMIVQRVRRRIWWRKWGPWVKFALTFIGMIALWLVLLIGLTGCTGSTFHGATARPDGYGGGYLVVGEACEDHNCEPAVWLCSPSIGGKIACGPVPIEWWD